MASNTRGENIVLLDLRGRSPVTEFFVIATGTSPRQMRTVAEEMRELGKRMGFKAWQTSGVESARWILVDCVNVVIHIFSEESREFYDLELLWGDCPRIDWRKELGLPPAPEWKPRAPAPARLTEEERLAQDFGDDEDDDLDDDDNDLDTSVMVEIPDESTGSNSVEFIEVERPFKKRKKGRSSFPTTIEDEDTTEEERSVYPIKSLGGSSESRDQDARQRRAEAKAADDVEAISAKDISRIRPKAAKKVSIAKKPVKAKAVKSKAVKRTAKAKPAKKKIAARKPAPKKPAKAKASAAKKPAPKKKAAPKKSKKK